MTLLVPEPELGLSARAFALSIEIRRCCRTAKAGQRLLPNRMGDMQRSCSNRLAVAVAVAVAGPSAPNHESCGRIAIRAPPVSPSRKLLSASPTDPTG